MVLSVCSLNVYLEYYHDNCSFPFHAKTKSTSYIQWLYNKHSFARMPLILLLIWYGLYRIRTNKDILAFHSWISFYLRLISVEWGLCLLLPLPFTWLGVLLMVFSRTNATLDEIQLLAIPEVAACRNEFGRPIKLIMRRHRAWFRQRTCYKT